MQSSSRDADGIAIVRSLANVLDRLMSVNAPLAIADPGLITKFHALKPPGIGIYQYLERIHKYASCSNECFVLALIYIDRLIQRNNFLLTELNVHRVVLVAILLAAKFFDDAYYNNAYYAKVGGVHTTAELNGLEVDFLFRIHFSLRVTPELFQTYQQELMGCTTGVRPTAAAAAIGTEMTMQYQQHQTSTPRGVPIVQQEAPAVPYHYHHHHQPPPHLPHVPAHQFGTDVVGQPRHYVNSATNTAYNHRVHQPTYITPSPPSMPNKVPHGFHHHCSNNQQQQQQYHWGPMLATTTTIDRS